MGLSANLTSIPEMDENSKTELITKQQTQNSQTASDFIDEQLALEADAREILPYKFDECTNILGPLRQTLFACLTCSPPPASPAQVYTPAGVCYACSIACHSDHNLVELFSRRNFVCDCGTTRMPSTSKCMLRSDPSTGEKGIASQPAAQGNSYNHNFQNRFCNCGEEYDAEKEKGTMFQCLGLGTIATGGCGEDWYHPECLLGMDRTKSASEPQEPKSGEKDEHPLPPGFPAEDDFEAMLCYKCVESNGWIKQYANAAGFLPPVYRGGSGKHGKANIKNGGNESLKTLATPSFKRKAEDDGRMIETSSITKRARGEESTSEEVKADELSETQLIKPGTTGSKHESLPPAPTGTFSLFLKSDFREHICHCPQCYPHLIPHPQLVEEEDTYEPSLSDSENESQHGPGHGSGSARSHGTGSLLDRGEAALSTMDRVKAIEGVMVYNHLRDKVKEFLKPYAESGKAVSAEDIKAYFERLRGDEAAIREAQRRPGQANGDTEDQQDDNRREQSGY